MVILLEPVCNGWMHEEVNAGFLKLVSGSTSEEVMFVGEEEHIKSIKKIYYNKQVKYKKLNNVKSVEDADNYQNIKYYYMLLKEIVKKYAPSTIFVTCAYRPCILATELFAVLKPSVSIYITLHGMIEKTKGHELDYYRLFQMSQTIKNVKFITYSPFCTNEFWKLNKDKMVFLHHPYIKAQIYSPQNNSNKVVIGIIGACANQKALTLVKRINRSNLNGKYEFWVASRFGKKFKGLPNVHLLDLSFERKSMEKQMQEMDYLLLLYGKQEYAVSASGVLWDAVSNKIPCLTLDSKYFEYYMKYNIGYMSKNINQLSDMICRLIEKGKSDKESIYKGIDMLNEENHNIMKALFNEV